jgi:hypothetical protein
MSGPPHPRPRPGRVGLAVLGTMTAAVLAGAPRFTAAAPAAPAPPAAAPAPPAAAPAPPAAAASASPAPRPAAASASPAPRPAAASASPAPRPASPREEIPAEPPRDPNDAPFMRAPNNQPQPLRPRTSPDLRRGYSSVRRLAFTAAPLFASFRLPFLGRPDSQPTAVGRPAGRTHGVGLGLELDVQLIRWIWLRAQGSYSVHPVGEGRMLDKDMKTEVTAAGGTIRALGFGAGPVIALDLGRFLTLLEGGIGGLRVATPGGVQTGQLGKACGQQGACDVGLRCGADNKCQQGLIPELYFGAAVDLLVRRHLSFGAQFRYHALLSAPGKFPVYLLGGLRVAVRF